MLNTLLTNASDKVRTVEIPEAALYALVGFAIVFVGILFLIAVVWAVGKIMAAKNGNVAGEKAHKPLQTAPATPTPSNAIEEVPEEVVAVITAALMAYYQQNQPHCEFTVKRIKRI